MVDRARAADVVLELVAELGLELGILARALVGGAQLVERRASASRRRTRRRRGRSARARRASHTSAFLTSAMKAAIFAASLMPFADSTPLDTSTPQGRTRRIASPTFSRRQPAGQDHGLVASRGNQRPVEALADAAVLRARGCRAATPPRREKGRRYSSKSTPCFHSAGLDVRQAELRAELGRFLAVELQHRRVHAADHLRHLRGVGIHEQRHGLHERRQRVADLDARARPRDSAGSADRTPGRWRRRRRCAAARASPVRVMPQILMRVLTAGKSPTCGIRTRSSRGTALPGRRSARRSRGRASAAPRATHCGGCLPLPT